MHFRPQGVSRNFLCKSVVIVLLVGATAAVSWILSGPRAPASKAEPQLQHRPRMRIDTSGYSLVVKHIEPWWSTSSLEAIGAVWAGAGHK